MFKKITSFVLIMTMVLAMTGVAGAGNTIKIGEISSMVGILGPAGELILKGAQLAVDMANEDGGVNGSKLELINIDGQSKQTVISNASIRLMEEEGVVAGIGPADINYLSAAEPIFTNHKAVLIDPTATTPSIAAMSDYVFMTPFGDDAQARALAKYLANTMNCKKAAIIKDANADYSLTLAEYFTEAFEKFTGDSDAIVVEEKYQTGDQDFSAQLTRIRNYEIDALFIVPPLPQDAPVIAKQARQFGIDAQIVFPDAGDYEEVVNVGKDAVEGAVISTHFSTKATMTETADMFIKEYKERNGVEPGGFQGLGFDSAQLIIQAISKIDESEWNSMDLQSKRQAIQESLMNNQFDNLIIPINYQPNKPPVKPVVFKQVQDGKRVFLKIMQPEDFEL